MSFSTYYPTDKALSHLLGAPVTVHRPLPAQVDADGVALPTMYLCSLSDGSTVEAYADELGPRPTPVRAPLPKTPCYCDSVYHRDGC